MSHGGQSLSAWQAGPHCPVLLPGSWMQARGATHGGEQEKGDGATGAASEASTEDATPEDAPDESRPPLEVTLASPKPLLAESGWPPPAPEAPASVVDADDLPPHALRASPSPKSHVRAPRTGQRFGENGTAPSG